MKHVAALLMVAIVGCKSGDTSGSGSATMGSGSAIAGSGSDSGSGSAMAGSGSGSTAPACLITITLTRTNISWTGGGISEGHSDYKPGEPPHLDVLRAVAPTCEAFLVAANDLKYRDVISVMDAIIKLGLVDVSLGEAGNPPTKKTARPQPNDLKWVTGPDGKPMIQMAPLAGNAALKDVPVLVITKTQVMFKGDVIGKPDDDQIGDKIAAKLPANPKDPMVILQADADTSALTINHVIWAVSKRGYTDTLFAVKNK